MQGIANHLLGELDDSAACALRPAEPVDPVLGLLGAERGALHAVIPVRRRTATRDTTGADAGRRTTLAVGHDGVLLTRLIPGEAGR